jgi:uncharacterized protein YeaO (DUF488 family)
MIKTKSIHEPKEAQDGTRLLIATVRPRWYGKKKDYDEWIHELTPSSELLNSYKHHTKPDKHSKPDKTDCDCLRCQKAWDDYEPKFRHEMQREESQTVIHDLAQRVKSGETITLICWCKVTDKVKHCHRIIVKELIESQIK